MTFSHATPTPEHRALFHAAGFQYEPTLYNRAWRAAERVANGMPTPAQLQVEISKLMPLRQTGPKGSAGGHTSTNPKIWRLSDELCGVCGARMLVKKGKLTHPAVGCRQQYEFEYVMGDEQRRFLP